MKKIFTLFAGLLMTVAVFAADRRPTVTIKSSRNYKVVIDGRTFFGDFNTIRLDDLSGGYGGGYGGGNGGGYGNRDFSVKRHTIKVYEMSRGLFRRERMVDAASFIASRNDIMIVVDGMGQIHIREMAGNNRYDNNDRNDNHWNNDRNFDQRNWDPNDRKMYDNQNQNQNQNRDDHRFGNQ